jgi:PAS domain S-box-containing protein
VQQTTSNRLPSIRAQITLLVLACALPTIVAFCAVVHQFYLRERDELIDNTRQTAHTVAIAIDRELAQADSAARVLATSTSLRRGDLPLFRERASALLGPNFPVEQIILSDRDGAPLQHTGKQLPAALTPAYNAARLGPLFASGRPMLSVAAPDWSGALAVDLPVYLDGQPQYALTMLIKAERLAAILAEEKLSPQQAMVLYDSNGIAIAQSGGPARLLGQALPAALAAPLAKEREALLPGSDAAGLPIYLGASRSPASGITVTIATPQSQALKELLGAVMAISLAMGAVLLTGFSLAWLVGGRIARSVRALLPPAQALASGAPLVLEEMTFREAQQVGDAFQSLDADLRRHRQHLETLVAERTSQLEKSRAQLETLYATAPVGLSYVDNELRIVRINDYLAAINARPVTEHLGCHIGDMIPDPDVRRMVLQDYRTVLDNGKPLTGIERSGYTAAAPDRLSYWVLSYYPQFGANGKINAITGLLLDITEQKRVEAQLRESKQLFKSVVENMPAMIFVKRAPGMEYELFNRHGAALLGIPADELVGKTDYDVVPKAQADAFLAVDRQVLASDQVLEIDDEPVTGARGETHYLTTRKVALRNERGEATHVLGMSLDITERKQAEQEVLATTARLAQSEHFVRTVTDNLPGMVAYWDAGLRCRFANRYFLEWHNQTSLQISGALMPEVMGAEQFAQAAPFVDAALAGQPQGFPGRLAWPSGDTSYTWTNYIPDMDDTGAVRGFFVLVSDVTELKETELHLQQLNEELVQARDRAEAASRAKSAFLANMSHEIRTPMNAIIGLARLLEDAPLEQRERGYLGKIQLATQSLLGVVNDVLDFSRIEAGQMQLEQTRFQLDHILSSTSVLLAGSAWDKGIEPVYDIDPGLPLELVGDPMRLQQVLLNLMSNAIKFTSQGEVVLAVRALADTDPQRLTLEFTVRDTGIGIPPEQQQHIFDAFSQADSSTSRRFGGAGLGLAICRRLTELMGGTIRVDSTPGSGSRFRFTCPLLRSEDAAGSQPPQPEEPQLQGLSLLIVDDNPSVCQALGRACAAFGWRADCVATATQALQRLQVAGYDLLLLDYQLSGAHGGDLLAQLRAEAGAELPPVLLMVPEHSSSALADHVERQDVAGVLPKPASALRLLEQVSAQRLQRGAAHEHALHTPLSGRLHGMHILLVEDNEINQEVAQYLLLHAGATVEVATNGQLAVDLLRQPQRPFDAVLMDVQMPVLNGYDATFMLRNMGLRELPVIAMTANVMDDDRRRAAEAGMNAHVAKPIDVEELIGTLTRLVPHPSGAAAPAPGPAVPAAAGPAPAPAMAIASPAAGSHAPLPGIALDAALPRLGGSYEALTGLLKRFEQSHGNMVAEIRQQLAAGDLTGAGQLLHRVRGVAANLGALDIARRSAEVEALLHAAQAAAEAPPEEQLAQRLEALAQAVEQVAAGARSLAPEAIVASPSHAVHNLPQKLAELQSLLQNNNLKALTHFQELRPALAASASDGAQALADAVETLNFKEAERMVEDMLQRKESA